MHTAKIAIAAVLLSGIAAAGQAAMYGPYDDPVRLAFARERCAGNQWRLYADTYQDCIELLYYSYPNDPEQP